MESAGEPVTALAHRSLDMQEEPSKPYGPKQGFGGSNSKSAVDVVGSVMVSRNDVEKVYETFKQTDESAAVREAGAKTIEMPSEA